MYISGLTGIGLMILVYLSLYLRKSWHMLHCRCCHCCYKGRNGGPHSADVHPDDEEGSGESVELVPIDNSE
jgi:hypothetical protein